MGRKIVRVLRILESLFIRIALSSIIEFNIRTCCFSLCNLANCLSRLMSAPLPNEFWMDAWKATVGISFESSEIHFLWRFIFFTNYQE